MRRGLKVDAKSMVHWRVALELADAAVKAREYPNDTFLQDNLDALVSEYAELQYPHTSYNTAYGGQ